MELCNLGENCSFVSCHQLDFLPIKCEYCEMIFCNIHNFPSNHDCKKYTSLKEQDEVQESIGPKHYHFSCSLSDCKKGELTPVICDGCSKNFCLQHRHMLDHGCASYVAPINPMSDANEKVLKMTSQLKSCKVPRRTSKNDKLAAKINLMKMKGKSVGNKGVPQEERIYFSVRLPKSSKHTNDLAVFVSKLWTVGRIVDAIADVGNVENRNNESLTKFLNLFRSSDGSAIQPLDRSIKSLLEAEELFSGQSLILEYGPRSLENLENLDNVEQ